MAERARTDVVVAGAGMAGLVAGVTAVEHGADVIVLEKGDRAGGSMALSQGFVWTYGSMDEVRELIPHGDRELQELVVGGFEDAMDWLSGFVETTPIRYDMPGIGREIDPEEFTETMIGAVRGAGGEVRLETPLSGLRRDDAGRVTGAWAERDGERLAIEADAVVLATGGFQGNEELVERHVTDDAENLWLRSNPWSTGDGLLAAKEAGAKTTLGMGEFYAHNLPAPPASFSADEFGDVSQYYGPQAVALDESGERFTDESESDLEETLAQDTARRAGGRAYYVIDGDLHGVSSLSDEPMGDVIGRAAEHGGRTARAATLPELGERLSQWGVRGERAVETIRAFNEAIRGDERLDPPRESNRHPIDSPPFYAVEVQPGITFTMGGLAVDGRTRVLSRAGNASGFAGDLADTPDREAPIRGLYAAGTDVGNVHHRRYLGGLATALVTGRIAGEEAAGVEPGAAPDQ